MEISILSLLIWMPIFSAGLIMFLGRDGDEQMKWFALVISIVELIASLFMLKNSRIQTEMQFIENHRWIEAFNINYALGVDSISITLIVLTVFMTLLVILASWKNIKSQLHYYLAAFLMLEGLMIGVFCA